MKKSTTTPIPLLVLKRKQNDIWLKPVFQRNFVWKKYHKELLIDTIVRNFYIPEVIFGYDADGTFEFIVIDGQQRIGSIFEFMEDGFKIRPNTIVDGVDISGLVYSKLPEKIKNDFDGYTLNYVLLQGTPSEMRDMFLRLQNGVPLAKVEARNAMSETIRNYINETLKHPFFTITCQVTEKNNKRMRYNEIIEQLLLLQIYGIVDIKDINIKKMYEDISDTGMPEETTAEMNNIFNYLYEAFGEGYNKAYFKKINIHALYLVISEYIKKDPEHKNIAIFAEWFVNFEHTRKEEKAKPADSQNEKFRKYLEYMAGGTGNKESLNNRKKILLDSWNRYLKAHPDKKNKA